MRRLRALALKLLRGPHADLIAHDLEDLYARDRAHGLSASRAHWRYARLLAASALSVWRAGDRHPVQAPRAVRAPLAAALHAPTGRGGSMLADLRFALRLFRKHPAPVGIAIGGLALAIGAVTSVFAIVDASMLRPYGMDDPETVARVTRPGGHRHGGWPYAAFLRMRDATPPGTARLESSRGASARIGTTPTAEDHRGRPVLFVSGGYLDVLGGRPSLGRSLLPSDDLPGAPPVVVVSDHFWETTLGSDASAPGKTLWVNGAPAVLVGVLEPGFTGPVKHPPAIWAPLAAYDDLLMGPAGGPEAAPPVDVVARLAPDASWRALEERLAVAVDRANPAGSSEVENPSARGVRLSGAASPIDEPDAEAYAVMVSVFGLAGLILALACANTANLLMAGAVTRRKEVGVRLALGATRGRLVRQMIHESLLLGAIAGAAGVLLAIWIVPIVGAAIQLPPEIDLGPDARVLLFTAAVAVVCGLGAGLSPARHGARGQVLAALQSQSGSRGAPAMPSRVRTSFVAFQAAASMLLLVFAALLVRSALTMTRVEVGFDAARVFAVTLTPVAPGLDHSTYLPAVVAAVRSLPSIEQAAVTRSAPFAGTGGHTFTRHGRAYRLRVNDSDEAFLAAVGVPVLRGRTFTQDEVRGGAAVALLSESAARALFPDTDPIGQTLLNEPAGPTRRQEQALIVGVVADAMLTRPDPESSGIIYRPLKEAAEWRGFTDQGLLYPPGLVVRTANPGAAARAVEDAIRQLDARVRPDVSFPKAAIDAYLDGTRTLAWLLGPPALLALALAAMGVFGVTALVVSQRTEEVSVRLALGASPADVRRLLVKDSLRPVVVGLATGLGLAVLIAGALGSHVVDISPYDPVSIAVAVATLVASTLVAVLLPARRAATTDPARLLRQE
jgi:predicted permease